MLEAEREGGGQPRVVGQRLGPVARRLQQRAHELAPVRARAAAHEVGGDLIDHLARDALGQLLRGRVGVRARARDP